MRVVHVRNVPVLVRQLVVTVNMGMRISWRRIRGVGVLMVLVVGMGMGVFE